MQEAWELYAGWTYTDEELRKNSEAMDEVKNAFISGYQARDQECPWVKIDDLIVETWKDGRPVDLWHDGKRHPNCINKNYGLSERFWSSPDLAYREYDHGAPTHAMLPPNPPKETE